MMECATCRARIPEHARFCSECGAALSVACLSCGANNQSSVKFCGKCGIETRFDRSGPIPPVAPPARAPPGERRHLSVMFCDLVGSTELSTRLDPEDLGAVIRAYQGRVAGAVTRFNGFVARYVGDGILIYFGWPRAGEANAEQAIRAALAAAEAVSITPAHGETLSVRIGIATGLVVVDRIGTIETREDTVAIGETPNRAARLQGLVASGGIMIDAATRQQVGELFIVRSLGAVPLKGLPNPIEVFEILGDRAVESRFEALRAANLTPLIGRRDELDLLLRRWVQTKAGESCGVLIAGEPGIGKSRLLAAFEEQLKRENVTRLRYFCSQHHQDTPFYPVTRHLEFSAGFAFLDTPADRLEKLRRLLAPTNPPDENVTLIAALLGLPVDDPAYLNLSPQRRKERTFTALHRQLERLTEATPAVLLFEDVHWADPSTLEILDDLVRRLRELRLMLVITFRSDFQMPWTGYPGVSLLTLSRLNHTDATSFAVKMTSGPVLTAEIVERIVAQSDGVPLFIEELTKAVVETAIERPTGTSYVAVPASLQASLLTRLDRIPNAKLVAQIGAVFGRYFSLTMISIVADLPPAVLHDGLDQLVASGLVQCRGEKFEASYTFKHALVRDAVYDTLLRERRRTLHLRIGEALESQSAGTSQAQAEQLAWHFTEAGSLAKGLSYWTAAGRQAFSRSAMAEAAAHLEEAIKVLLRLPESAARLRQELDLQIALGRALISARGYSAPGTGIVFTRSRALSDQLGDTANFIRVAHGQWTYHLMRAEMKDADNVARELLERSERDQTIDLRLNGHRLAGATLIQTGQIARGNVHLETAQSIIDQCRDTIGSITQGNDALVGVPAFRAIGLALLGRYGEARKQSAIALEEARRAARPHRKAFALGVAGCWFHGLLDEDVPALHEEWGALAEEQEFPFWRAYVIAFRGLRMAKAGARQDGLALVRKATGRLMELGAAWGPPFFLGNAAQFAPREDRFQILEEASELVSSTGVAWFAPELERIRGALTRELGDFEAAEFCFRRALEDANRQGSRHWALRSALSLADLWFEAKRPDDARALLAPIYAGFDADGETDDLRNAAALLGRL